MFEYWREFPPAHEHLLIMSGYKRVDAPTKVEDSTMNPLAFARWVKSTGGRKSSPNG